jgi:RNA polymerase sigma-70 factor, ECF subfamily
VTVTAAGLMNRTLSSESVRDDGPGAPGSAMAVDFATVVARYESPLLRYVGQMLGGRSAEADDVVQETFISLHRHLGRHGPQDVRQMSSWLYRVAHNKTMDVLRRRRTRREQVHGEQARSELDRRAMARGAGGPALERLADAEAQAAAMAELSELPETQRAAITLKVLEGMTMKEIGQVLDMAPSNVCYHLGQGLAELSRRLKRRGLV